MNAAIGWGIATPPNPHRVQVQVALPIAPPAPQASNSAALHPGGSSSSPTSPPPDGPAPLLPLLGASSLPPLSCPECEDRVHALVWAAGRVFGKAQDTQAGGKQAQEGL